MTSTGTKITVTLTNQFFFLIITKKNPYFGFNRDDKMGKSKRAPSPNRKNSNAKSYKSSTQRRRSMLTLVSPHDITEETLQIWQSLPQKIRQDPSLEPFRLENERVFGE